MGVVGSLLYSLNEPKSSWAGDIVLSVREKQLAKPAVFESL